MIRCIGVVGWLVAAVYFGGLALLNYGIVSEFYYPEGPWPGWWPLVEADALYGGAGLLVVLLVRLAWRRWLSRAPAGHALPL